MPYLSDEAKGRRDGRNELHDSLLASIVRQEGGIRSLD